MNRLLLTLGIAVIVLLTLVALHYVWFGPKPEGPIRQEVYDKNLPEKKKLEQWQILYGEQYFINYDK